MIQHSMNKTFSKFLVASCVICASSFSLAASGVNPVQAPSSGQPAQVDTLQFLANLKAKLKIAGPAQEKAWDVFLNNSGKKIDMATFQELNRAKTTPELMNGLETMQAQASQRFGVQKKVILNLYDVLDESQRKMFDEFVFSTMTRMGKS